MDDNGLNVKDEFKDMTVPQIREIAEQNTNPFSVCILSVTGGLNISTIIRTAHNFGVQEVMVIGKSRFDRRGMVGAQNYTQVRRVGGLEKESIDPATFEHEMNMGMYYPIFVEQGGRELGTFSWLEEIGRITPNEILTPCLVFGNENEGIPENIMETHPSPAESMIVSIPQCGVMRSPNVAPAAGIVMWDICDEMGWV